MQFVVTDGFYPLNILYYFYFTNKLKTSFRLDDVDYFVHSSDRPRGDFKFKKILFLHEQTEYAA